MDLKGVTVSVRQDEQKGKIKGMNECRQRSDVESENSWIEWGGGPRRKGKQRL